jgi:hypothetical protein
MNNDENAQDTLKLLDLTLDDLSSETITTDTIDLSDWQSNSSHSTLSIGSITPTVTISASPYIGTTMGTNGTFLGTNGWHTGASMAVNQSGILELQGDNADIKINGVSLCDTLTAIQDKLNILRPNKELEHEWDQLRELGERYRELEIQLAEKQKMWNTLKSMPPPEID